METRVYEVNILQPHTPPRQEWGQVILRHTELTAYRCFLPDLAGFTGFCCTGPSPFPGQFGGEGGIRTHGPVAGTHAFQACRFVHSRTSPRRGCAKNGHLSMHVSEQQGERPGSL